MKRAIGAPWTIIANNCWRAGRHDVKGDGHKVQAIIVRGYECPVEITSQWRKVYDGIYVRQVRPQKDHLDHHIRIMKERLPLTIRFLSWGSYSGDRGGSHSTQSIKEITYEYDASLGRDRSSDIWVNSIHKDVPEHPEETDFLNRHSERVAPSAAKPLEEKQEETGRGQDRVDDASQPRREAVETGLKKKSLLKRVLGFFQRGGK